MALSTTYNSVYRRGSDRRKQQNALSLRSALLLFCLIISVAGYSVLAQTQLTRGDEYKLKAAFLYNFAQFVEWPKTVFPDTNAPIVIGVLGTDPFGEILDQAVRGQVIGKRPLKVRRIQRVQEVGGCHILFLSRSEEKRLARILPALRRKPILTVSDIEDFAEQGGMISFATEKNRIRFHINTTATKTAGLSLSSKLLRLAKVVETGRQK